MIVLALLAIHVSVGHLFVDRRNERLTTISTDINPNVTILTLHLESNYLTLANESALQHLAWLQQLYIGHNKLNLISQTSSIHNTKLATFVMFSYTLPEFSSVHYNDAIMNAIASQITSLKIVFSIVYLDTDKRKHQRSASLVLCEEFIGGL